jgi:hypothetical protein
MMALGAECRANFPKAGKKAGLLVKNVIARVSEILGRDLGWLTKKVDIDITNRLRDICP